MDYCGVTPRTSSVRKRAHDSQLGVGDALLFAEGVREWPGLARRDVLVGGGAEVPYRNQSAVGVTKGGLKLDPASRGADIPDFADYRYAAEVILYRTEVQHGEPIPLQMRT